MGENNSWRNILIFIHLCFHKILFEGFVHMSGKENLVKLQGHEKKLLQIFLYPIVFYLKNNMNISLHSDKDLSMLRFTTSIGLN